MRFSSRVNHEFVQFRKSVDDKFMYAVGGDAEHPFRDDLALP